MVMQHTLLLFPTPLFKINLGREFTKDELNFINSEKINSRNQNGGMVSNNQQFLDCDELKDVKSFCDSYLKEVYKLWYESDNEIYMTQSWANYSKQGGFHLEHMHPNSFLSGVIYIEETFGNITFLKTIQPMLQPTYKKQNIFNASHYTLDVIRGDLIIFPSDVKHMVDSVPHGDRISIAFNTFVRGSFGNELLSTKLEL